MEQLLIAGVNMMAIYSSRVNNGSTLTEYEALAYEAICDAIASYYKTINYNFTKALDRELNNEDGESTVSS